MHASCHLTLSSVASASEVLWNGIYRSKITTTVLYLFEAYSHKFFSVVNYSFCDLQNYNFFSRLHNKHRIKAINNKISFLSNKKKNIAKNKYHTGSNLSYS